jgi:uncharacterized protein YbjT (DUF2867 family)
MGTVLVCGATGTTGLQVLGLLQSAGADVRALTRSPESASRLRETGADAVVGDLGEPSTLPAALDGVRAVYLTHPAFPDLPEHEGNLARAAGVAHLVKLSVIGVSPDSPVTFQRLLFAAEQQIKESGVAWTMVRSNGFMQNTSAWAPQIAGGTVYGPVMDARWSIIDARDVAAAAATVLQDTATHTGRHRPGDILAARASRHLVGAARPRDHCATNLDRPGQGLDGGLRHAGVVRTVPG